MLSYIIGTINFVQLASFHTLLAKCTLLKMHLLENFLIFRFKASRELFLCTQMYFCTNCIVCYKIMLSCKVITTNKVDVSSYPGSLGTLQTQTFDENSGMVALMSKQWFYQFKGSLLDTRNLALRGPQELCAYSGVWRSVVCISFI